ncbi:hypothetical protein ACFQ5X_49040, partial [Streptomyces kaempferi]
QAPEREPFWFLGGQARILLPGAATDNRLSLMEFADPIGHGPPHHVQLIPKPSHAILVSHPDTTTHIIETAAHTTP